MRMRGSECIGKNAYECMAAEKEIRRGKKKKRKSAMQSYRKRFTMDEGLSKAVHSTKKQRRKQGKKFLCYAQ